MKSEEAMVLLRAIQSDIDAGRLILPTLPDTATQIRQAIQRDPGLSAETLANIIESDVATATHLVNAANSAMYGKGGDVGSVKQAIQRLGNFATSQLVCSFVIRQLFNDSSNYQRQYLKQIWQDSVNIASLSRAFAMFAPHLDPEEAMLAGLTHQIGKLPIIKYYANLAPDAYDKAVLDYVLNQTHGTLGHHILQTWKFPKPLIEVPLYYRQFDRVHRTPADYADLVQVAYLQSIAGTDHPDASTDWSSVAAFEKLGFDTDDALLDDTDLAAQLEQLKAILDS